MSKQEKQPSTGAMLDLWRPPHGAGDPIGCLATTYTFAPGLFDEQCLARFLEIGSEPDREDLAFLLERESRLGGVYAAVLVDHTQAGVEHSLRWYVLPVRVRGAKQHAKISLLAWDRCVRLIVASANLTEPGYRSNREVAAAIDLTPEQADGRILAEATAFLRSLVLLVPGAAKRPPEVRSAEAFLDQIERHVAPWQQARRMKTIRRQLTFTLPAGEAGGLARSSLEEAVEACRGRGGSPTEAKIASPFFDADEKFSRVTASLCKLMGRGGRRELLFCVPAIRDEHSATVPRLAAPKALVLTPPTYQATASVGMLPEQDRDKNPRRWHAKMLALRADQYSALMIGSSNFTCAGMGVGNTRNAEANLLTVADRVDYGREVGQLEAVWPGMEHVTNPESAEWLGARPDTEEEEEAAAVILPAGFLLATYRAGAKRQIVLRFEPADLPTDWSVDALGQEERELLTASDWHDKGSSPIVDIDWAPIQPPRKLLVRWADQEAFLPLNVEDSRDLPAPEQLEHMSADDMLLILAAADPSAAFRAWARRQRPTDPFDADLDSATPSDLDPLRRYDLQTTFLHRIRHRARVLAQLRANLERPVWGRQALDWRLRGLIGVASLADRLIREFAGTERADEALLTLADFLIVLRETDYKSANGSLTPPEFAKVFRPFLRELANSLRRRVEMYRDRVSEDVMTFWERVAERCQA